MASCPLRLGPERHLFRTALRRKEGWKPRPRKSFEDNLAPEECFSPLDLFNKVQEQNEELGLIIDLTYTHRYYKPEGLPETVPYLKMYTIGHQVPDDDTIFKFKYGVNGFLKENKDNGVVVAQAGPVLVICPHGANLTGLCRSGLGALLIIHSGHLCDRPLHRHQLPDEEDKAFSTS